MNIPNLAVVLRKALATGILRDFDMQLAVHLSALNGESNDYLTLATVLVSNQLAAGDVCVVLRDSKQYELFSSPELNQALEPPVGSYWAKVLRRQSVVGEPGAHTPLILDSDNRLYLGRYWQLENQLVDKLQLMLDPDDSSNVDLAVLRRGLAKLFKPCAETDWQKIAAANALLNRLSVITGGPGTGKTYTVAAILGLLAEQQPVTGQSLRIALAAPTGKAAARLTESIASAARNMPELSERARPYLQLEGVTLHRLLRIFPGRVDPAYHGDRQLPFDVVIVDEASMVDLPLMARTLMAISHEAKLILLGDKDQLSSVESGMVLGDICGGRSSAEFSTAAAAVLSEVTGESIADENIRTASGPDPISNHIVYLQHSHRSKDGSGIPHLAQAINRGDFATVIDTLRGSQYPNLTLVENNSQALDQLLQSQALPFFHDLANNDTAASALQHLEQFSVLCALRRGPFGVEGINRRMVELIHGADALKAGEFYHGLPVMVTRNDSANRLYNGDRGLLFDDGDGLRVCFSDQEGLRQFSPQRLPQHERLYAMTIHKSQGSEYDTVIVVLPDQRNRVVTRELLYTAVTRARRRVVVVASTEMLQQCLAIQVTRRSGLRQALWPGLKKRVQKNAKPDTTRVFEKKRMIADKPVQTSLDL